MATGNLSLITVFNLIFFGPVEFFDGVDTTYEELLGIPFNPKFVTTFLGRTLIQA